MTVRLTDEQLGNAMAAVSMLPWSVPAIRERAAADAQGKAIVRRLSDNADYHAGGYYLIPIDVLDGLCDEFGVKP